MDENTIDYGTWICPTSWNDITLKQLQDIQKLYSGDNQTERNIIDYIHILTNHTREEVEALPYEFTERLLEEMSFLLTPLPEVKAKPEVIINGEKYVANVQEKMKTGEFIATQMALQSDANNYAAILAIIARKEGEVYDSKFENEILPQRIELFKQAKALDVLPMIVFFFRTIHSIKDAFPTVWGDRRGNRRPLCQAYREFNESWSWLKTLYNAAEEDFTKVEKINQSYLLDFLQWLSYSIDKGYAEEEQDKYEEQRRKAKRGK